ncbi:aminomethyl-transferring glycine dehydrogenase subunit GcvPB [Selenihalanaerobacter shriftii]|uniref:Probable glycine dehydrogenase (decarboxylating) subunit 2 n=1 Tax=Selenihalanaerobacter shriftii TaxID=142842 RepID=A0A1T4JJT9_9FIRM|nr:aminomethyl-transferring glycine dehydrogenase subunit GcvPB [Selenihalanaerobacter shriftii]SJZ30388.1 glycine dehydrogenase (decarboxylating) beta subunit [Selenihalanaerobacter shriftii]
MRREKELIFELGKENRVGYSLPEDEFAEVNVEDQIPEEYLRDEAPELPEVSELEAVRHFTELSTRNHGVDNGFYPLGSCTMKYNAKVNEDVVRYPGFTSTHPLQSEDMVQGNLELIYDLEHKLSEITGMDRFTMQPAAGAHGELTGLMIIKEYLRKIGADEKTEVIVPDSAHGTNPASASMVGFKVVEVESNDKGLVDIDALKESVSEKTAGLMLTNPNTLGLFEEDILEMAEIVHDVGGLLYYDGANMNAIMGKARPGDMGFDVVHLNLHKTFGTPHGGGGPGSGPVGVTEELAKFLPKPLVEKDGSDYSFNYDMPDSIGKVRSYYGNFGVAVKAYAYLLALGAEGVKSVSEDAVLNANYLKEKLKDDYKLPYDRVCKHEFVFSGDHQKENGVATLDIAKRLLDFGVHPPTIYFPLIVHEALMIEPTETENKESLDQFIDVMKKIAKEAKEDPERVQAAPHNTVVGRLDETTAARKPQVRWKSEK